MEIPALTEQKIFVLSQQAGWAVTFQISLFFGMRKPLLRAIVLFHATVLFHAAPLLHKAYYDTL